MGKAELFAHLLSGKSWVAKGGPEVETKSVSASLSRTLELRRKAGDLPEQRTTLKRYWFHTSKIYLEDSLRSKTESLPAVTGLANTSGSDLLFEVKLSLLVVEM